MKLSTALNIPPETVPSKTLVEFLKDPDPSPDIFKEPKRALKWVAWIIGFFLMTLFGPIFMALALTYGLI